MLPASQEQVVVREVTPLTRLFAVLEGGSLTAAQIAE
jgi:hypothetical protein